MILDIILILIGIAYILYTATVPMPFWYRASISMVVGFILKTVSIIF